MLGQGESDANLETEVVTESVAQLDQRRKDLKKQQEEDDDDETSEEDEKVYNLCYSYTSLVIISLVFISFTWARTILS